MRKVIGKTTWHSNMVYMTLSCAQLRWPELFQEYKTMS